MELNPDQRRAVDCDHHSVVVACPGSGKTRVLVERAVRLRRLHPQAEIIVVTFTRQAAAELRARMEGQLETLSRMRVATFHSLALQQLLSHDQSRICGPAEQLALLRLAAQAHLPDIEFRAFQAAADAFTSGHASALDRADYQLAYDAYLELMAEHSAVDFGHGVLKAVEAMERDELTPFACDYLLVDEVQDIDPIQVRWVYAHTRAGAQLMIVGDDDQSVYAFRSALGYRGMKQIGEHHSAIRINLSINYRSHQEVLGLASRLISHNTQRVAKRLTSARGPGGSVKLHSRYWTDVDEDHAVAATLGSSNDQWAIIARTNRKLDRVAHALRSMNIPFTRPGRTQFWESEDPSLFLRLLQPQGIHDPLTRAAASVRIGVSGKKADALPAPLKKLDGLLRGSPVSQDPEKCIHVVAKWMRANFAGIQPARVTTSMRVVDQCKQYLLMMDGSLSERIAQAQRPRSSKEERIVLLTMHAAKGREFPSVWIVGCQDGTIPNKKADDVEEERRLLYVAMTRAERELHLSFAWNQLVTRADCSTYLRTLTPSRFLSIDMGLPIPDRHTIEQQRHAEPS